MASGINLRVFGSDIPANVRKKLEIVRGKKKKKRLKAKIKELKDAVHELDNIKY